MDLEYTLFMEDVNSIIISWVIDEIDNSNKIEIADELEDGRWNHVVIKGTKTPIAYIGDDTLQFVNYRDEKLKEYHKLFNDICLNSYLKSISSQN